jgi:hypothetical protein
VKDGDTTVRASDRILHNLLFFHVQRSLRMGDVFVTMLAYRKFVPNCAWRAEMAEGCRRLIKNAIICWNYLYLTQKIAEADSEAHRQA